MMYKTKVLKDINISYYKYGNELNATKQGAGGVYNADTRVFSASPASFGWLTLTSVPPIATADSWEIHTKVTRTDQNSATIMGTPTGYGTHAPWIRNADGRIFMTMTDSSGNFIDSQNIWANYPNYVSVGQTIEFKLSYSSTEGYKFYYRMSDSEDFVLGWSTSSTAKVACDLPLWFLFGPDETGRQGFYDMYMGSTSITINGEEYWRGTKGILPATPDDYDFTEETTSYKVLKSNGKFKALKA